MESFFQEAALHLQAGHGLALATIMASRGSAPRTSGARMLVLPDGSIRGTIGGGSCEGKVIEAAMLLHAEGSRSGRPSGWVLEFSLRGVTDLDMICGGDLTVLLEYLPPAPKTTALFSAARVAEASGQAVSLLTCLAPLAGPSCMEGVAGPPSTRPVEVERRLLADWRDLPPAIQQAAGEFTGEIPRLLREEDEDFLLEYFPPAWRLHIFGGGHVGLALAELSRRLDFIVHVLDDREEFTQPERFPGCLTHRLDNLGEAASRAYLTGQGAGGRDAIVILTRGHAFDRDVLAAALSRPAGYLGMIGSKTKRAAVYKALMEQGVTREALEAVHSPIGLTIGAETPWEIAVSIAAELIQWRRGAA